MTLKWYERDDGKTVLYGDTEDVEKNFPGAVEIPDRPSEDHIRVEGEWVINPDAYKLKREREYPPIGDQLDAILKHLNYMQLTGQTDLVSELDHIVVKWITVKAKYPKGN